MKSNHINAGDLIHRVTVQSNAVSIPDPTGDLVDAWTTLGTYWALVTPLGGQELFYAKQTVAEVSHRCIMRQVTPISAKDRILFQGRVFNITTVYRAEERNEYYVIMCVEQKTP